jgi:NAD(P)-dependent dehydrogenase (short-subunit alcohol dehydrogenase family)
MMKAFSLEGETALITGGGAGLGFGMAFCFVQAGARVVLVGRREEVLAEAAATLGANATYEVHDVTEMDKAPELVARITQRIGEPTILVNNAGIHLKKPAVDTEPAEFQKVLTTHVVAAHALTKAVLPGMLTRRHGSILFTASMTSLFGVPLVIAYSAAKAAYLGMVRSLAVEVSGCGVRVNAVAPGWIDSEMSRKAFAGDPQRREKIISRTPMGILGEAEDVGWAAVYLCSPAAKFVTGVILPVDGGVSIGF